MSSSFRFFIFAVLLALSAWSLYPTVYYYFVASSDIRQLVERGTDEETVRGFNREKGELFDKASALKKRAVALGLDIKGGVHVIMEADFEKMARDAGKTIDELTETQKTEAMERVQHKLQTRIDQFGVSEVVIRKIDEDRISVQIPGEQNTARLMEVIGSVGKLEFMLVDDEATRALNVTRNEKGEVEVINPESVPEGSRLYYLVQKDPVGVYQRVQALALYTNIEMTGDRMSDSRPQFGEYGDMVVGFSLDLKGAALFSDLTGKNKGKRLAIVLDDKIMSAPNINERIPSGNGVITGSFSRDEAKDLSLILRSGSMPVPIRIISQDVIGPTLGKEQLLLSRNALFAGLLLVVIFIVLRYRVAGLVTAFALTLNGVGILALLAPLHYTITLPGIAGLILTIGMAVDANVIIFERIREEIKLEKRPLQEAVTYGYARSWWSILDANLTTLIAAAIMAYYGTGVVQGFAVVLFIGIVISLLTSLGFTRLVFELLLHKRILKEYSWYVI